MDGGDGRTRRTVNLDALFDDLLTSGVTLADPQRIRKLRVLNTVHLVIILSAPFLGLFYFYIGAIILFYVAVMAGLMMAFSLLLLRRTKSVTLNGNLVISILWVVTFLISWNTGGITYEGVLNPSWMLQACLILLAVFLMGYLHGTIWTLVAFFEIGLVVYLYRIRFQFPNVIPYDMAALYHLATFLIAFLVMVLMAFLFESDKEEALTREQVKTLALRESTNVLDEVLERFPIPTFVIDRNHRVVQWNMACQKLTGLSAGDALGKLVWDGFRAGNGKSLADMVLENPSAIEEQFSGKFLDKSESGGFEVELFLPRLKAGRQMVVIAAPLVDEGGTVRGAIQTVQDAVVPVDTDPSRQDSASGSFNEVSLSPVFKVNGQGKIVFWNRACEEHFGYSSAQMTGEDAVNIVSKRYRALFEETIGKALEGVASGHKTWRYEHKEGKPLYAIARVYPVVPQDGEGKECAVVNTDVTELALRLRQAKIEVVEARVKLKSVSEEHDLLKRNIATFIRGKDESRPV
jgi:PAS domain S-box-containing protein